jgi:hypothetical protein
MAIRSGTGGLKYPLPNQGQLSAQMSAAAASSGGSAAASTFGANRSFAANKMRVQADLANSAAERQFRAMSQMEEQGFRAQQQFYDREHFKGAQLQEQGFRAGESQLDREFETQRDTANFQRETAEYERRIDAQAEADIRSGKRVLSPKAQEQLRQLEDAESDAKGMDAQQQADWAAQKAEKRRQIIRGATEPVGPTADEEFNKGTIYLDNDPQSPTYGKAFPDPGPGRVAGRGTDKGFVPSVDTSAQDKQQQEQQKKQQEADQKLKEDIYKAAQERVKDAKTANAETTYDFQQAYDAELKERRLAGAPTPEAAPADPGSPKGPVLPSTAKTGTDVAPSAAAPPAPVQPAPQPPQRGIIDRAADIAEDIMRPGFVSGQPPVSRQPDVLPANPGYQAPTGPATSTLPQTPDSGKGAAFIPVEQAQTMAGEIRAEMKDAPLSKGETPQMRDYFDQNMETILQYQNTPLEQVPEEARGPVDFYGRVLRSSTQGQPIVLKTPDEAAMLPPDTPFIDDQGIPRRTPKGKMNRTPQTIGAAQ